MKQKLLGAIVGAIICIAYWQARQSYEVTAKPVTIERAVADPGDNGIIRDWHQQPEDRRI